MNKKNIIIGITIGDINGIGIEVLFKSLSDQRILNHITPVIYGSTQVIKYYKNLLDQLKLNLNKINTVENISLNKPNIINVWDEEIDVCPGKSSEKAGLLAFLSLEKATSDLASGKIDVLVTAPINKKTIQNENFKFPGHTEYLTQLSNMEDSLMLMVYNNLRISLATNHIPISELANSINVDVITRKINLLNSTLIKDFRILKPKIAVLGLNPHAGELGLLGGEEKKYIIPAIKNAKNNNILCFGPFPSDGFFGSGNYNSFDGVLAMYHDQGLTPFKTIASGNGVNFTAGIPIVRTSPDHGTAYDIAGKGIASCSSMRNAIYLAIDIYNNRLFHKTLLENPLTISNND